MGGFEDVRERADLREFAAQHLEPAPGRNRDNYICPACESGTGKNKSAAFYVLPDGRRCYCHVCHWEGDVFDLWGLLNDTTDKAEQLRGVAAWAGVPIEDKPRGFQETMNARARKEAAGAKPGAATDGGEKKEETVNDYSEGREKHRRYVAECAARLSDGYKAHLNDEPTDKAWNDVTDYLETRGIGIDEACALGIGYDPNPAHGWQDEAGEWHKSPRLVLPWLGSDYYHIDRAIDERARNLKYDKPPSTPTDKHPLSECVGAQPLYNPEALSQDYVIVCEGVLDAIAVQLCGFNAIALGGTAVNDFATEAAGRSYGGVVIDMLDADGEEPTDGAKGTKGRGAGADLINLLGEAGITTLARGEYGVASGTRYGQLGEVAEGYKDAGEWYAADPQYMKDFMSWAVKMAHDKAKRAKEADYREAMKHFRVKDPAKVARDVLELRNVYEPIPTGIRPLDDALDGGVNRGELTIFGAISSYGKTTIAAQICDHMASAGRTALFATLEQSGKELLAKSLSRLVYTENATGWNIATPSEITSLKARKAWGDGQRAALAKAVDDYTRMIAPRVKMLEGGDRPTVWNIRDVAKIMAEHDGQAPVIFLDYLQLLAPLSDRYDDKKNADVNVSELRKLARDLNTHVWCISSLNRSSYSGVISLDSFKESGGIEYGADLVLGLQPRDMEEKLRDVSESKRKREADKLVRENKKKKDRDCELVILKRRNGAMSEEPIPLLFKTMSAYFMEPTGSAAHQAQARPQERTVL